MPKLSKAQVEQEDSILLALLTIKNIKITRHFYEWKKYVP